MREWLKDFKQPVARWVLPVWNHVRFDSMPIDDPGSCHDQHILCYGKFHRYQDTEGRLIAILCPERLSYDQNQSKVQDDPPGSWEAKVAGAKVERLAQEQTKRRKEAEADKIRFGGRA